MPIRSYTCRLRNVNSRSRLRRLRSGWSCFRTGWIAGDRNTSLLSDHLRDNADRFVHPFLLDTAADRVRSWCAPGALVLGDAAHTMSPVGGQGLNIALRDAVVAANQLVPVLSSGGGASEVDAAARRVEVERLPEVKTIQQMQSIPPRFLLKRTWWAEGLRQIPQLLRFAPIRTLAARGARPFLYGTTDVTLRV